MSAATDTDSYAEEIEGAIEAASGESATEAPRVVRGVVLPRSAAGREGRGSGSSTQPQWRVSDPYLPSRAAPRSSANAAAASDRVASLEYRLSQLAHRAKSPEAVAGEVLAVLRQLLIHETGTPCVEDALPIFAHRFFAETGVQDLLGGVLRDAEQAAQGGFVPERFLNPARVRGELDQFIAWWQRRHESLRSLEEAGWREGVAPEFEHDAIFNVRVAHDQMALGLPGIAVSVGLFLRGRVTQPLWVKLFVNSEGMPVVPRVGFEQWVDDENTISAAGDEAGSDLLNADQSGGQSVRRLAAVIPIQCSMQRQLFDRVTLFLPYRAMLLPGGNREVELQVGLYDEYGFPVCETSCLEVVSIPRSSGSFGRGGSPDAELEASSISSLPSPQRLGMWPEDPATASYLKIVAVTLGARMSSPHSLEDSVYTVSFDIGSGNFGGGGVPHDLTLECRVVDERGAPYGSRYEQFRDSEGAFVMRQPVAFETPMVVRRGLRLDIPCGALALDGAAAFVELALVAAEERLACGVLSPLPPVAAAMGAAAENSQNFLAPLVNGRGVAEQVSGLSISHFAVSSSATCGDDSKERAVRAEVFFCDSFKRRSAVRAALRIETLEGREICRTSVLSLLAEGAAEGSAVLRVPERWVRAGTPSGCVFPLRLMASVDICALDGALLARRRGSFQLSESSSFSERTPRIPAEASLVEIEWNEGAAQREAHLDIAVNLMRERGTSRDAVVYIEAAKDAASLNDCSDKCAALVGRIFPLPLPATIQPNLEGPFQVRLKVPYSELGAHVPGLDIGAVKLMLFGATGKLQQSLASTNPQRQHASPPSAAADEQPRAAASSGTDNLGDAQGFRFRIADRIRKTFSTRSA